MNYRGLILDAAYRLDLVVENAILVELMRVERLDPIHAAQTITCLKLPGLRAGLLFNFDTVHLRDGLRCFTPLPTNQNPNKPRIPPSSPSA